MTLDPLILLVVVMGTVIIGGLSVAQTRGIWQRLLLLGMYAGLLFYSGIGAAYYDVPNYYLFYYFGFIFAFAFAFWFFNAIFNRLSISSGNALQGVFKHVECSSLWLSIIWLYIIVNLFPLVYPEMRLYLITNPPLPDLATGFALRWLPQRIDVLSKLIDYIRMLLTPFFFIALYRYRNKTFHLILIILLILYVQLTFRTLDLCYENNRNSF